MTDQAKPINILFDKALIELYKRADPKPEEIKVSADALQITAAILTLAAVLKENLGWMSIAPERRAK